MQFLGVDLGWYGKPSGVACLEPSGSGLRLAALDRLDGVAATLDWIDSATQGGDAIVAVDAPTIIANATGARPADRAISSAFGRYEAGCHSANLSRPFAALTTDFGRSLADRGFAHASKIEARKPGRYQIEVFPHPAIVNLFSLDKIIKYKKGRVAQRRAELARYRGLMLCRLPDAEPGLRLEVLPDVPTAGGGALKAMEDELDAIMAAYIGAHWWWWGCERNAAFGNEDEGYIVVPNRVTSTAGVNPSPTAAPASRRTA